MEHTSQVKGDISFTSSDGLSSQATNDDCTEINECRMEINQESVVLLADPGAGTMHGTQKLRGASLLEYFTPEQIRTHINSLRQFVGPTKSKAEQCQAMQNSSNQSRCQLCCMEHLSFTLAVYCNLCGLHVKREAIYYTTSNGGKQSYICPRCFRGARGESIEVEGFQVFKSNFVEKRNIDELNEEWVQCSGCGSWNHQICVLFNKRSYSGQTEYVWPYCFLKEVEGGKRNPLPQSDLHSAKDLPTTILSDHLEQRLLRQLNWEREERAKVLGRNFYEVPGAKDLVVRVFLSVDKKLQVNQRFLEIVNDESYSSEFPYKSKAILLFQKKEGVDVCLFCMYVQEYGSECPYPNNRRVCLPYVDSVKYFQPAIKSITGEALRTFVYHEILVGYLEYCKRRGFMSCHIWVCPTKGDDYILYCHPEIQKTPKATDKDIVVEHTNMYEQFFVRTGEKKAKVTLTSVPYFDGDYFSRRAEYIIANIDKEDGEKRQRVEKDQLQKWLRNIQLKLLLQMILQKEALLTQKLGDSIRKKREDFIVVHMQHACKYCGEFELSRKLRVCMLFENFYLGEK
ncbi:probable histone acetyltransferase HAC-like 1 [Amborella trichopoda]|nr:probable histone acetyltransferase HAC-like 1 [Amborella trichopoda]|eukprot:XP_020529432.1 probable histone acetyltransferase HAC-like 1 [Amborella trichopoda]